MSEIKTNENDIFEIEKDPKKEEFISSHTYTNIFSKIPAKNNFSNINNIFNQSNKAQINNSLNNNEYNNIIKLKVILNYSYQKDYFEFNFPIKIIYNYERDKFQFSLNEVIDLIYSYSNNKSIFLNEDYSISYTYNNPNNNNKEINKTYYFISNFPLDSSINYNLDIPLDGIIYLKFRKRISKIKSLRYDIFEDENEEEIDENEEKEKNEEEDEDDEENEENEEEEEKKNEKKGKEKKECKRSKEKRIGYIVKKVFYWKGLRKLTKCKMSLEDCAKSVHLSKKTLDEYFNQIKEGKKYGFDFNKCKKDKVNVLRGYVKKMKEKEPKEEKKIKKKNITNKK